MIVPYGDKDSMHSWKHVLDASEYNMGMLVNSLKLGCDCLGEIHYFDVHQVTWEGKVKSVENAICMHEEDYGIQWKHYDSESQTGLGFAVIVFPLNAVILFVHADSVLYGLNLALPSDLMNVEVMNLAQAVAA